MPCTGPVDPIAVILDTIGTGGTREKAQTIWTVARQAAEDSTPPDIALMIADRDRIQDDLDQAYRTMRAAYTALQRLADTAGRLLSGTAEASPEVQAELRARLAEAEDTSRDILRCTSSICGLIDASSLGEPDAVAARASVPEAVGRAVVARAAALTPDELDDGPDNPAPPAITFHVETVDELLGQLVGACSTTRFWDALHADYPCGAGVFRDDAARALLNAAADEYERLTAQPPAATGELDDDEELDWDDEFEGSTKAAVVITGDLLYGREAAASVALDHDPEAETICIPTDLDAPSSGPDAPNSGTDAPNRLRIEDDAAPRPDLDAPSPVGNPAPHMETTDTRTTNAEIRAWCQAEGIPCSGFGAIPRAARDAYTTAHQEEGFAGGQRQ